MKIREKSRDYMRLLLVILFYFSPILMSPLFRPPRPGSPSLAPRLPDIFFALQILAVVLNFIVEIYEFYLKDYAWEDLKKQKFYLVLRLFPWIALFIMFQGSFKFTGSSLLPIFAFYLFLSLPPKPGFAASGGVVVIQVLLHLDHLKGKPVIDEMDYVLMLYRIFDVALLTLFAHFWRRGKETWKAKQELTDSLRKTQEKLTEYAGKVARVVALEERTRLARDIHDSLGHGLTAAAIQLNKAAAFFERDPLEAKNALQEARNCIQEGMEDIRSVVEALNREGIDLFTEIRKIAGRVSVENGPKVSCSLSGNPDHYNNAVLFAFFRFFQEGLTNALKHAGAGNISLLLDLGGNSGYGEVKDDGRGFDPSGAVPIKGGGENHYGLLGLRDRISLVRGTLTIQSSPGGGTILKTEIPRDPLKPEGE